MLIKNLYELKYKLLILIFLFQSAFSQLPLEYYKTFNEGVLFWQKKPHADYENAFIRLREADEIGNRYLIVNPFLSYDVLKFRALELTDGNRRFVRFLMNMHQNRPALDGKFDPLTMAWNITEKFKSYNFRYEILKSIVSRLSSDKQSQLKNLFDRLESTYAGNRINIEQRINEIVPEYKLLSQQTLSTESIKQVLKPGEILISFLMGDNRRPIFVWKIDRNNKPEVIPLEINTADLFCRIECLRADFQNNKSYKDEIVGYYLPAFKNTFDPYGASPPFTTAGYSIKENLRVLAETVIQPLHLQEGTKLIVATDQNISALPFEILPFQNKRLMDAFDITYTPSARVFYFLRQDNPSQVVYEYNSFIGFSYDDNGEISDNEINSYIGSQKTIIQKATESAIYDHAQEIYLNNIIHFSTHGKVHENINRTRTQYLQYYADQFNDGIFSSSEIIQKLRFNQSLVVLSACETAPSLDTDNSYKTSGCLCSYGETFSNLTGAFFIAGARNLIMTQWDVRTKESTEFFEIFYEKLNEFKDVAKALKETKKDLLNNDNFGLYAPFILVSY